MGRCGFVRWFFVFSFFYAVFQISVTMVRFDVDPEYLYEAISRVISLGAVLWFSLARLAIPLALVTAIVGLRRILSRWSEIGYAACGSVLIQLGFSFTRTMIETMVPYYADPGLASFDRWLHFGVDPWRFVYTAQGPLLGVGISEFFYIAVWSTAAMTFPVLLALTDASVERVKRFLVLFLFCWLGIGTVLATGFASVGPIFYDRLLGGDRFAELVALHTLGGMAQSGFGATQEFLWRGYIDNVALGGGMSAFPSVHLAVATLFALYLTERCMWLAPVGVAFVAIVLIISVTSGYHYAIDGYASIILVIGAWKLLARVARRNPEFWGAVPDPA